MDGASARKRPFPRDDESDDDSRPIPPKRRKQDPIYCSRPKK